MHIQLVHYLVCSYLLQSEKEWHDISLTLNVYSCHLTIILALLLHTHLEYNPNLNLNRFPQFKTY